MKGKIWEIYLNCKLVGKHSFDSSLTEEEVYELLTKVTYNKNIKLQPQSN